MEALGRVEKLAAFLARPAPEQSRGGTPLPGLQNPYWNGENRRLVSSMFSSVPVRPPTPAKMSRLV